MLYKIVRIFSVFILFFVAIQTSYSQQTTLYNSTGDAVAYIDFQDKNIVYLFDGTPIAIIENDGCNYCVYAINGNLIGWFTGGIIYDRNGYPMVVSRGVVAQMKLKREPDKKAKKNQRIDWSNHPSGNKEIPELKDSWSVFDFKSLLLANQRRK